MKHLFILVFAAFGYLCFAGAEKPLDTDLYFAFPRAVVVTTSGETKAWSECSHCFQYPTAQQPEPHFAAGHEFENGISASWEFVRQTDHGDVYLIVVGRPGKPETVTLVLFTGQAQTVVSSADLRIQILPENPKNKRL